MVLSSALSTGKTFPVHPGRSRARDGIDGSVFFCFHDFDSGFVYGGDSSGCKNPDVFSFGSGVNPIPSDAVLSDF